MTSLMDIEVRALREMGKRIQEDITREHQAFATGGWINQADVGASGMQAVRLQAKIAGLEAAMIHLHETNKLLTGKIEKKDRAA